MFIDEAEIKVIGGHGGSGKVAFYSNRKGSSGGDGGRGGSVFARATSNLTHLKKYTEITKYKGEDGGRGGQNKRWGLNGKDLFLPVPIGTTLIDTKTGKEITLTEENSTILLCKGGEGGHGNSFFKSSTNRTPKSAEPGTPGQERNFKLILKLIANYGLIGLPNAGKSSLLNLLTAANVRTANYAFTTLEPNLGIFNGKVIADVPGLIEGASTGRGLGIKFLKHIEKVELLLHCISAESGDIEKEYLTVVGELSNYNTKLLSKKSVILLTKTDLAEDEVVKQRMKILKKHNKSILPISIYSEETIKELKKLLSR